MENQQTKPPKWKSYTCQPKGFVQGKPNNPHCFDKGKTEKPSENAEARRSKSNYEMSKQIKLKAITLEQSRNKTVQRSKLSAFNAWPIQHRGRGQWIL